MKKSGTVMLRKFRYLFVVLLVVVFFSNTVTAATVKSFSLTCKVDNASARSMLSMINDFRTSGSAWYWNSDNSTKHKCGKLAAYTYDYNLEQIALQRAYETVIKFSHNRPDGSDCFTCTYNGTGTYGECIAYGYNSASSVFKGWREDNDDYAGQGHRRNMLSSGFKAIGIAHVIYNGTHYWVQEYGYSNSGAAETTALSGNRTATVRIDVSSATPSIAPASKISSIKHGESKQLPKISGKYSISGKNFTIPDGDIKNVKWTSADNSKLTVQNNSTVKAVGTGSCKLSYSCTYDGKTYSGSMTVSIAAKCHMMTKVAAKAATDQADGNIEYYLCSVCKKKYADAEGKQVLSDAEVIIPRKGAAVLGEELPDKNNKYRYKITNPLTNGNGTVSFIGLEDMTIQSAGVPATVELKGSIYKVNKITSTAFRNNKTVKTVFIGANVTVIEANAFRGCTALVRVSGGAKVKTIGTRAFANNPRLKTFVINSPYLAKISPYAFASDKKLKTITIKKTTKLTKAGVKKSLKGSKVKKVKVKKSKIKKYKKIFKKSNSGRKVKVKK